MRSAVYTLAGAIVLAAGILAIVTRYSDKAVPQGGLYVTDRWTGSVKLCGGGTCRIVPNQ